VLDVGAGFGFFSVIAARAGAARVDAVELNPAVHLGPRVAEANGCADRIVFHHLDAERLTLDRPADVIVSDLRGPTPFCGRSLQVLIDVRQRLLRPGGVTIPARDTVFAAPARVPEVVSREVRAGRNREGVVLTPVERVMDDTPTRCVMHSADLLAPGQPWAHIEYGTVERTDFEGNAEWTFDEPGLVSGLASWFDTDLGGGFGFSAAPGTPTHAYSQVFIPFRDAVRVSPGDRLRVHLALRLVLEDYVWAWRAWLTQGEGGQEREILSQNSMAEIVIDPRRLHRSVADIAPPLGPRGQSLQAVLERMDGRTRTLDLSVALHRDSPALFPDVGSATMFISKWIAQVAELDDSTS
jgi:SAM-dependent methyltransferase